MASTKSRLHKTFGIDVAAHGDLTDTKLDPTANLEDRTEAFIVVFKKVLNGIWKSGDPALSARLLELMRGYKSSTDIPICYLGPETYAAYSEVKYILTTRPGGKDEWFESLWTATSWHFRRDGWRYLFRFLVYLVRFLRRTDDKINLVHQIWERNLGVVTPELYHGHNDEVKRTVPAEKLLVYDVRHRWAPLCEFLGEPVPDELYPNLNEVKAMNAIYFGMMAYGAFVWCLYLGGAAVAAYLALRPEVMRTVWQRALVSGSSMAALSGLR